MVTMERVKERPILFSAPMVRAILEGRKTQTRRIVKPQPTQGQAIAQINEAPGFFVGHEFLGGLGCPEEIKCPYGQKGDRLWARETWAADMGEVIYRADSEWDDNKSITWKPSIHMPRKHSRITLEVVNVRVERLQDISEEDAIAEGVSHDYPDDAVLNAACVDWSPARLNFCRLWESINGKGSWDANPWVWCVEFKRVEG